MEFELANCFVIFSFSSLLQESEFEYHFSARLKPWVHYVPITYTTADIIEKILWLQQHEHAAYRIAQNAKNFGQSYLRLEDFLCYSATLLKTLSNITSATDANEPFDPIRVPLAAWD